MNQVYRTAYFQPLNWSYADEGKKIMDAAKPMPVEVPVEEANLWGSRRDFYGVEVHYPTLDIDIPTTLIASSTPGHFHLLIEKGMSWRQYKKLLKALAKAGILEQGYVDASIAKRGSYVRVPWVRK